MALSSMTGFGHSTGAVSGRSWSWEIRSVNNRGLDIRFRLPAGLDSEEPALRTVLQSSLRRGSLQAALTLGTETTPEAGPTIQHAVLQRLTAEALTLAAAIGAPPPRAEALLALPGVLATTTDHRAIPPALRESAISGFTPALHALLAARRAEGTRLAAILEAQLTTIATLTTRAATLAAAQPSALAQRLHATLAQLPDTQIPPDRLAQEIALLATKADVREELDRLASHTQAAHALLADPDPVGRRLDFLTQEFNREVNTLCSKSASLPLTEAGLQLKAVLEQFREQVQNVE